MDIGKDAILLNINKIDVYLEGNYARNVLSNTELLAQ
jgi:hypothetical protein